MSIQRLNVNEFQGLDVSEFQGNIDWTQVKNAGYQFAMVRAGYGFCTLDQKFLRNITECNRVGIPAGVYWFCYAVSPETAVQEADACIDAISSYRIEYPVSYDIEQDSIDYAARNGVTITPDLATQIVTAFCNRIEERGYFAMYYSNQDFLNAYLPWELARRYALWYAYYGRRYDGIDCGIWQYTSTGRVPGIEGNADLDISFIDYASIIREGGFNHLSGMPPTADYITYVVQPEDTLSEIAERYGTTYQTLAALNVISNPDMIYAGQTIRIPEDSSGTARYYTIQPGDTLSELALRFGTTVNALAALNGISNPNLIYAGTTIRIS